MANDCIKEKRSSGLGMLLLLLIVIPATLLIVLLIGAYWSALPEFLGVTTTLDFLAGNTLVFWIILLVITIVALLLYFAWPMRACSGKEPKAKSK